MTTFTSRVEAVAWGLRPINEPRRLPRVPTQEQLDSMLAPHAKQVQRELKAAFLARRERRSA